MPINYQPGYSRFLEGLSEPFTMAADARRQRRKDDEYKRQNDLIQQRESARATREARDYEIKLADRNKTMMKEIGNLAENDQFGEAEAMAAVSEYIDPKTGKSGSFRFNKPVATDGLDSVDVAYPQGENAPEIQGTRRFSKPSITTPRGETIEFDPAAKKKAKEQALRDQAKQLRDVAARSDPVVGKQYLDAADRIEAQLPGAEVAQMHRVDLQNRSQTFQDKQGDKRDANRIAVKKIRPPGAGGAGAGGLGTKLKEQRLEKGELEIEDKYDGYVQKIVTNLGFKDINKNQMKLDDLAKTIAGASDNAALKAFGAGQVVKLAQGGTGVVSDQDMKVFWDRIGGLGMRAREAWQGYLDGTLSIEKRKIVADAVNVLQSSAMAHGERIGKAIAEQLPTYPGGAERVPRYLGTYGSSYTKKWQAEQAKRGNADALKTMEDEVDRRLQGQ